MAEQKPEVQGKLLVKKKKEREKKEGVLITGWLIREMTGASVKPISDTKDINNISCWKMEGVMVFLRGWSC